MRNIQNIRICMGKKPILSVTYENERISIKNSLPYLKCVLSLSCVVHGPIYVRFMGFHVNGFLGGTFYSLLGWSPPRTMTVFSFQKKLQTTLNISFFAVFLSSHATEPFISLLYLSLCTNCYCFFSVSRDAHYTFTLHSAIGFTTSQGSCLQTLLWALL